MWRSSLKPRARGWIHLVTERARRESPSGSTVAHGHLTLAVATAVLSKLIQVDDPVLGLDYGVEKVCSSAALHVGSCYAPVAGSPRSS